MKNTRRLRGVIGSARASPARSICALHRRRGTLDGLIAAGESGRYDFAYIDADKPQYDAYYERCLTLLRSNGLLTIDNVLWSGNVADPQVIDEDTAALRESTGRSGATNAWTPRSCRLATV